MSEKTPLKYVLYVILVPTVSIGYMASDYFNLFRETKDVEFQICARLGYSELTEEYEWRHYDEPQFAFEVVCGYENPAPGEHYGQVTTPLLTVYSENGKLAYQDQYIEGKTFTSSCVKKSKPPATDPTHYDILLTEDGFQCKIPTYGVPFDWFDG